MGQPGAGDTASSLVEHIDQWKVSGGTETSQYPEEKTQFPE
jgi:hypothetical protein